jgi:prophage regulatory protein
MPRELPNRFNSSLRIPPTRSSSARRPAPEGTASRRLEPTDGNNGSTGGEVAPARLLRFPTVRERTGLSRSTIWRLERRGDFPRHRRISANAVAWVEQEVTQWIRSRSNDGAPSSQQSKQGEGKNPATL